MPAIKYTKTAVDTDDAWDSSKAEAAIPNDAKADTLRQEYAWVDPEANADTKSAYKFPHHFVDSDGNVGAASSKACSAGIGVLNGGRGGANIPDSDRKGIYDHLAGHLKDAKLTPPELNSFELPAAHKMTFSLDENSFVADDGSGIISFPMGQVVSDDTTQRSGTQYDVASMDISEFNGTVTADHVDMLQSVIAKTNLVKRGSQVIMNALQFAVKENPFAQLCYDLYKNGYAKDFSIETYGSPPDETGLLQNSKLIGLSCVVTGNNRSATMNSFVLNSLETARRNGLDTTEVEKALGVEKEEDTNVNKEKETEVMYKTIKNSRDFAVKVTYKNAADEETEIELAPGKTIDVSEDQASTVESQINAAKNPAEEKKDFDIEKALETFNQKLEDRFGEMEKSIANSAAKEPEFHKDANAKKTTNGYTDTQKELAAMDWEDRTVKQIESARLFLTNQDLNSLQTLNDINKYHVDKLKETGKVKNSVDLGAFGNFVTSPELLTEIEGVRNDYSGLVNAVGFKETLSLEMAWLERSGDIDMQEVGTEGSPNDDPEGLKPISTYTATPQYAKLLEVAAVTPVSNAATRFLAVDLLSDVAEGYSVSYQKKLAEIIVARLQQAVNGTNNKVPLSLTTAVDGLVSVISAVKQIANATPNGTFVMNRSSELELFQIQLQANLTGNSLGLFQNGQDGVTTFAGRPYLVVPDQLLPSLNSTETQSFIVEGQTVTVDQAIFYADLTTISGRVSGGLNYSLSTEAAYEDGGVVKSAFQRDELVLRGFFFRNAAVRNPAKVASIFAAGIS